MNLFAYIISYAKIYLRWIKDINIRTKIVRRKWVNVHVYGFSIEFLDIKPKAYATKEIRLHQK